MSRIILPPGFILPPYHFAPYHFAPWKSFDVHYFPIPVSFCPLSFPPPGNCFMIYTIYQCPVSFFPLDSFCPHIILPPIILPPWKWFNDLHYLPMSRIILPPALDFVFILIKSPLQQKLMTGAHPVTVAPLVGPFRDPSSLPTYSNNWINLQHQSFSRNSIATSAVCCGDVLSQSCHCRVCAQLHGRIFASMFLIRLSLVSR